MRDPDDLTVMDLCLGMEAAGRVADNEDMDPEIRELAQHVHDTTRARLGLE